MCNIMHLEPYHDSDTFAILWPWSHKISFLIQSTEKIILFVIK